MIHDDSPEGKNLRAVFISQCTAGICTARWQERSDYDGQKVQDKKGNEFYLLKNTLNGCII